MIIELVMKHFRKHKDRTLNFADGLNAIRGPNEAGKTSMQLAIMYALWGTKALPLSLEEMVTWGHNVKELRVRLTIRVGGELYMFERHKNGAECNHSGGVVTGQNEVSAFATTLLGVDRELAQKLMFASQGGLRGALDSGATALSKYIEDLSGMDLFDILLDLIADKLSTGPTATLDATVAELEGRIAAGAPQEPDTSDLAVQIDMKEGEVLQGAERLKQLEAAAETAATAFNDANAKAQVRDNAESNLRRARLTLTQRNEQIAVLKEEAAQVVDTDRIKELEKLIADETIAQARHTAFTQFKKLPTPEAVWEGDDASLTSAITEAEKTRQNAQNQAATLSSDIREARAKMVTASVCGFCQQDMSKFPEVAKKNADLQAVIDEATLKAEGLKTVIATAAEEISDLKAVQNSVSPFNRFLQSYGQYVEVSNATVPPTITWKGAEPSAASNKDALDTEFAKLRKLESAVAMAKAKVSTLTETQKEDEERVKHLEEELAALPAVSDLDALRTEKDDAAVSVADQRKAIDRAKQDLSILKQQRDRAFMEYQMKLNEFNSLKTRIEEVRGERDKLVFNNALVKKIRAARPIVAAKLWAVLLSSVSTMFSQMRGEQSVVTKSADDFLVNGKPAKGLSGSTLDLLGLSIRVALVKTFIPTCSFLLLDEAMAACDDDRTSAMLGFIAASGFDQVLLITHEDISTACASNLVTI